MGDLIKKKVLFIDRDGTIITEPPITFQVDTLEQLEFLPGFYVTCILSDRSWILNGHW